ncbi:hypothetical protein M9Y10_002762 [Tritrichomonas musculus]|uniref:Cyclin N-terminal domain-containing protein n=1 Tax=Tritrichomonas musculus TaxID=1915356 RepID=A0ABR2LAR0_9EUKA
MQNNFIVSPRISSEWSEEKRRTVWFLISSARQGLGITIDPIVASAFIILQKYFRGEIDNEYDLFILMSAALFASCKAAEVFRSVNDISRELYRLCVRSRSKAINQIISSHLLSPDCTVTYQDMKLILAAEIDLLKANDYTISMDLPFSHFEKWKKNVIENSCLIDEKFVKLCNHVIVDICLLICSCYYLDVPPEVAAAAAASRTFGNDQWVISVRQKFGNDLFDLAMNSIQFEDSRTMKRH